MSENFLEFVATADIPQHLAWGLLHSLWLITLLAIIYAGVGLALTSRYARLRYLFGYAILPAMIVLPVTAMFVIEPIKPIKPAAKPNFVASSAAEDRAVSPRPPLESNTDMIFVDTQPQYNSSFGEQAHPVFDVSLTNEMVDFASEGRAVLPRPSLESDTDVIFVDTQPQYNSSFDEQAPPAKTRFSLSDCVVYLPLLSYVWFFGVALMSIRLCLGLWEIRQLRRRAFLIADGRWEQSLRKAAMQLGLRRKIDLRGSVQITSPLMIGVFRPMILVPLGMLSNLSPEQVEVILLHELAHVRRHDYLANLLQLVVETLLFYHPLVWWVSNSVRRDREYLCDDVVVHRGKIDNLVYAQALTDLETFRQKEGLDMKRIYSAPAAAAKPLLNRIKRIMNMKPDRDRRSDCLAGLVALVILAALPVWAVFFDSGPSGVQASALVLQEDQKEIAQTDHAALPPEEILLEVYSLEKIQAAPDMFDDHELQESLQEYLVQSYRGKYNPEIGAFPAKCKVKGNLLIVMGTAKQQEQIAAFLEKLEANVEKLAQKTEKETPEIALPLPEVRTLPQQSPYAPLPASDGDKPQFTQPQPYYLPQQQIPTYNVAVEQPDGSFRTQEPYVLAMPFANRKAKDFMELLLCDEDYREKSGTMFVDERSNTFIMVSDKSSDPVERSIARAMCMLFEQPELPNAYPDLESFLAKTESATVETYSLKHRSAKEFCHFINASLRSIDMALGNTGPDTIDLILHIAIFVDESDKTLIVARDVSCDFLSAEYLKNNLAKYDVPQTSGESVPAEPQEGKPVAQAFRLKNRSTGEFAMQLRNFAKAVMETNNKEFANSLNVYYDNNTQTVVVLHHENWIMGELPAIVSFYDAQPGTINYAYANLSDFLTKNPGAKAKSFSVKNIPAETLCHFLRCYVSGSAVPEDSMKIAFFADEKSKKLIVAHNMDEDDIFPVITKHIELCDQEMAMPPHEGMIPPPQVQLDNQCLPATDESPAQAFAFGDAFLENDAHGFGFSPKPEEADSPKAPAQEADALVSKAYYVADLVTNSDGEVDFDVLSDLIRETISPDDWTDDESETGNTIKAFHNARTLIIKAPEETHTQIADLLAQLREMSVPQSLR